MQRIAPSVFTNRVAALAVALLLVGCADPNHGTARATRTGYDRVIDNRAIHAGYISYPPSFMRDPDSGAYSGILHDVLDEIARRAHLELQFTEEVQFGTMIEAVNSGRVDLVCAGIWPETERAKFADFTDPVYFSPIRAYVRPSHTAFDGNLTVANDPGVRIAAIDGEMTSIVAAADFPKAVLLSKPQSTDVSQVLLDVASNKADLTFVEPAVAEQFLANNPGAVREVQRVAAVRVFPNTMLIAKGDSRLATFINVSLAELNSTGFIDRTIEKYEARPGLFLRRARPYRD